MSPSIPASKLTTPSFSLGERVAIVTGAAGGLGRAFCLALAVAGARLVAADLSEEGARQTAEAVVASGGEAIAVAVDVTSLTGQTIVVDGGRQLY